MHVSKIMLSIIPQQPFLSLLVFQFFIVKYDPLLKYANTININQFTHPRIAFSAFWSIHGMFSAGHLTCDIND